MIENRTLEIIEPYIEFPISKDSFIKLYIDLLEIYDKVLFISVDPLIIEATISDESYFIYANSYNNEPLSITKLDKRK